MRSSVCVRVCVCAGLCLSVFVCMCLSAYITLNVPLRYLHMMIVYAYIIKRTATPTNEAPLLIDM